MAIAVEDLHGVRAVRPALLGLNAESAQETSALAPERFDAMIAGAAVATFVAPAEAFLLAFASTDEFDGGHFQWFGARFANFLYVDRVVVAARCRRQGLGAALYADLFTRARRCGIDCIVCEVNLVPPNPGSDAFHAGLGFTEVGQARLDNGAKIVRYLQRPLP
ncbi:MAG: GNAT family N-acetyltransferase [Hyphomicrobiaceae bacterium]|nr:GNAT family N-acetyltransferase [Hyphomicrobiaceae bacterium]